jgi:uncharacterized protein
MKLFDASAYLGRMPASTNSLDRVEDLLLRMDDLGIQKTLVSHTLAWQHDPAYGNRILMEEIAGNPRLQPCWILNPSLESYGGVRGLEKQIVEHNLCAVRIFPKDQVFAFTDWMAGDLFAMLDRRSMLVFMDLDQIFLQVGMYDYDPNGLERVERFLQSYSHLSLVLTRLGYRAYQNLTALLAKFPNLYLDLSYFATHQGVEDVVQRFGASRILFGTSQPFADPGGALARLQFANITEGEKARIAETNLTDLLERSGLLPTTGGQPISAKLKFPDTKIIDAHGHLGPYFKFSIPQNDADGMVAAMDAAGVSTACISSHLAISADWRRGNLETLAAVKIYPERFIGHVVINPNTPQEIKAELDQYFNNHGFKAIKIVPDTHAHPATGKGYEPAWEYAAENNRLVLAHTFHGSAYDDPQMFAELSRRYPHIPIMVVHSGALTAAFNGAIRLARDHPNIYLDISGSYITGAWIKKMVDEAGADRVIYSSDLPFIDIRYSLGRVLYSGLTADQQKAVLGGNIARLLNLS